MEHGLTGIEGSGVRDPQKSRSDIPRLLLGLSAVSAKLISQVGKISGQDQGQRSRWKQVRSRQQSCDREARGREPVVGRSKGLMDCGNQAISVPVLTCGLGLTGTMLVKKRKEEQGKVDT